MTLSLRRTRFTSLPQIVLRAIWQRGQAHRETQAALRNLKPSELRDIGLTRHDIDTLRFGDSRDARRARAERSGNW